MNVLKPIALAFGREGGPFSGGRLRRTEFVGFVGLAAASLPVAFYLERHLFEGFIYAWTLLTQLPLASAAVNRLHDTGRRGYWIVLPIPALCAGIFLAMTARTALGLEGTLTQFVLLGASLAVSFVPFAFLAWQLLLPGQQGPNRFGPDPRDRTTTPVAA